MRTILEYANLKEICCAHNIRIADFGLELIRGSTKFSIDTVSFFSIERYFLFDLIKN